MSDELAVKAPAGHYVIKTEKGMGLDLFGRNPGRIVHGCNGLLIWLRDGVGPPDGGSYPLLSRGDSAAPRGAIASVRYILGSVAHGVIVDSGSAILKRETPPYALRINGNGAEVSIPGRRSVEITADAVPLEPDTVNCVVQL